MAKDNAIKRSVLNLVFKKVKKDYFGWGEERRLLVDTH